MRISISLFFLAIFVSILVFSSCTAISSKRIPAGDLLYISIVDDKGKDYSPYILTITDEGGEYIYSHVLAEGITGKIGLQGVKPGIYELHLSCTKAAFTFTTHIEYSGGYREEKVKVGGPELVQEKNSF